METLSLNGKWQLESDWLESAIDATVPGSVYSDLLNAGKIPDPFWRDNEMTALPLMEYDYCYTKRFNVSADLR